MFVSTTNVSPRTDSIAFGFQLMPRLHDQVVDLLQRFGPQLDQVVLDPPPIKIHFLVLPIANAHDLPQAAMVFRQVLQLVVIQVAAEPRCRQHRDFPIVHAASAMLAARAAVDILAHQSQQLPPEVSVLIKMLQRSQNRDDPPRAKQCDQDIMAITPCGRHRDCHPLHRVS